MPVTGMPLKAGQLSSSGQKEEEVESDNGEFGC